MQDDQLSPERMEAELDRLAPLHDHWRVFLRATIAMEETNGFSQAEVVEAMCSMALAAMLELEGPDKLFTMLRFICSTLLGMEIQKREDAAAVRH